MVTAAQLRAARGLLDWTRSDLAKASGLSPETIKNIEHGIYTPQDATIKSIIETLTLHGVELSTDDDGVRRSKRVVQTFLGAEGYIHFLEDIIATMSPNGGRTCQFNYSDTIIATSAPAHIKRYTEAMGSIRKLDAKCLVPHGDSVFPVRHCIYRWLSKDASEDIPFYIYNDKVAMMTNEQDSPMQWVVIKSESLAQVFYKKFDQHWTHSKEVTSHYLKK